MNPPQQTAKKPNMPKAKGLHPRNLHRHGYDFPTLIDSDPRLATHVQKNVYGNLSIDFTDPLAVKALNAALLKHHYHISDWDIPAGALCPPIPSRADYIHYIAELLGCTESAINQPNIKLLDIGTGANGIYPLLACQIYGWQCVGTDINPQSLQNVASIIAHNPTLKGQLTLRLQLNQHQMFTGIIQAGEQFDVSVCNPPFHASAEDAVKSSQRKLSNLARHRGDANHTSNLKANGSSTQFWWSRCRVVVQWWRASVPEENDQRKSAVCQSMPLVYQLGVQNRQYSTRKKTTAKAWGNRHPRNRHGAGP